MATGSQTPSERERDRAVSPVIGVLLLVAVTVLLGGAFSTFVLDYGSGLDDGAPLVRLAVSVDYDHDEITLEHTDGDVLDSATVRVIVSNETTEQVFQPTTTSSNLSIGESATIDLSLVDGNNRIDWDPGNAGWEYVESGSFTGISRTDDLLVQVVHTLSNEVLLRADIPGDETGQGPTPSPTPDPSDPGHAYLDKNFNGEWDAGTDEKIPDSEITDGVYDAKSDALVIPDSVGKIEASKIDLDGAAITVDVELESTGNQDVTVTAGSGDLVIEGVTVDSASDRAITLRGETGVMANGTTIDSGAAITVRANSGELHLSDATVEANEKAADITLKSDGDMYLESTTITALSGRKADASLSTSSSTLYVSGASISDGDDTLTYSPSGVTVDGSPASGSVAAG